jgi:laccase
LLSSDDVDNLLSWIWWMIAGKYYFGVMVGPVPVRGFPPPRIAAVAMFETTIYGRSLTPLVPEFPASATLVPLNAFKAQLRAYGESITALPARVEHDLTYVVGIAWVDCIAPEPCVDKIMGMLSNITFEEPHGANILDAYVKGTNGVYQTGFPDRAPLPLSVTAPDLRYRNGTRGTRVKMLNFGDNVRLVFQNVFAAGILDHPMHLHGHDFYVIGSGYGVYNPAVHPASFNLVDPPAYNTFGVPNGGWLAIQFKANNPGVWFMHCHFERHLTWGMSMAFITRNGRAAHERLLPPLHPLPRCTPGFNPLP